MTISINELINRLPKDTEKRIQDTKKRFTQIIQNELRKETGLLLNRQSTYNGNEYSESISIPLTISPGIPAELCNITFGDEYLKVLPLLQHRKLLENLTHSAPALSDIVGDIDHSKILNRLPSPAIDFNFVGQYCRELLEVLDYTNPIHQILGIHTDVMGQYIFASSPNQHLKNPNIRLYWGVIGLVANILNINIEALTCVVLTHEYAHGYSHMGSDIDGERWDTYAFSQSEIALVEGIAQYYTHQICQKLENRVPGVFYAYDRLLENQTDDYQHHLKWVRYYSPEIVRMAIIECRRNHIRDILTFENNLKKAADRLPEHRLHDISKY